MLGLEVHLDELARNRVEVGFLILRDRAHGQSCGVQRRGQFEAGEEGPAAVDCQARAGAQRHNHQRKLHGESAAAVLCELVYRTEHDPLPFPGDRKVRTPSQTHQLPR